MKRLVDAPTYRCRCGNDSRLFLLYKLPNLAVGCFVWAECSFFLPVMIIPVNREGIKPGTNARNPEPKSGTKFCQQNIAVKHACIELKFKLNVDYRLFFEMHISIFLHLPYFYYMQVKYRTMSWNTDPGPNFSVLTMSCNS